MRSPLCILLSLSLSLPAAIAAQEPVTNLRATNSEVLLDLVVRDKHAQIIRDLRPDEIQIFEDGVPQKLRYFSFLNGKSPAPSSSTVADPSAPAPSRFAVAQTPTINELREISMVSVVFANLDPRGRKLAIDAMDSFIQNEMRPNTFIGVFTLGITGLRVVQPYTNNGEKISAAVTRIANNAMLTQLANPLQLFLPASGMGSADHVTTTDPTDPSAAPGIGDGNGPDSGNGESGASSAETADETGPAAVIDRMMQARWSSELADVYTDSARSLAPLRALVQAQADIPGRKIVLLFAAGLPGSSDTTEIFQSVVSAANRSNVTIYAVDTRGETDQSNLDNARRLLDNATAYSRYQMTHASGLGPLITPGMVLAIDIGEQSIHSDANGYLRDLAEDTGGQMLPASLDLREPMQRAMEDVRMHYELTYSSSNPAMDGSFRKITVKVDRPGASVYSRSGYYAVPLLNGHQLYPYEMATLKVLNTKPDLHQFDFHAATLQFRSASDSSQIAYVFETPASSLTIKKEGSSARIHLCVTALIRDEQGQVVQKISRDIPYRVAAAQIDELDQGVVSFTAPIQLPPGHYAVETATVDRESMRASVSRTKLDVEPAAGLSMSDISIVRRVDPAAAAQTTANPLLARGGKVTPELLDHFSLLTTQNVTFYAVAYPPLPADAPIQTSLEILHDGRLVTRSPNRTVSLDENGAASILASLPIGKLTPGRYEAQITFQYKDETVRKRVGFTLDLGS